MKIIAVDDDEKSLEAIGKIVNDLMPEEGVQCFDSALSALALAREERIDVAFLDIRMPELSGMDLGRYLRDLNPFINLIFLSEHREYGCEIMALRSSGYLLKPASKELVKEELASLRFHPDRVQSHRVFIQTFGNFEFFVDGKPVAFKYNRTKEMLAVLVNNRGAQTTNGEIIACLWEDDGDPEKKASYLSNLRQDLQNTFRRLKLEGIILKQRGSMAIAKDRVECDLYDWLEKKKESRYQYTGDYMNQYDWPEYYHAELDEISYALYGDE